MQPKPSVVLPALYGGIIIAAISAVPGLNLLNCLCCAGVLLGGVLSVFFYKKDLPPDLPLTSGDCVKVGALAGVFSALIGALLFAAMFSTFKEMFINMINSVPQDAERQQVGDLMEQLENGSFARGGIIAVVLFSELLMNTAFGLLGGLIGYAIWKPSPSQIPPPPYMPPNAPPPPPPAAPPQQQ